MSGDNKYEKPPATAPPSFSSVYPTGGGLPETSAYGFQQPPPQYSQYPQSYPPGYPQSYPPGYPQSYPPGYPQPQYPQSEYVAPPQVTQPAPVNHQTVVVMGGCPSCRVGVLEDSYTCCGILCAICFFPIGIICCIAMKEKRCVNCNASF